MTRIELQFGFNKLDNVNYLIYQNKLTPELAYWHAKYHIKGPCPKFEYVISTSQRFSFWYAYHILYEWNSKSLAGLLNNKPTVLKIFFRYLDKTNQLYSDYLITACQFLEEYGFERKLNE